MGIVTKAKQQLEIEEQKRKEDQIRWENEYKYRAEQTLANAANFINKQLDDVKLPLSITQDDGKVIITKYNKKLVEITFGYNQHFIEYFEDFIPHNTQSYQHIKANQKKEFYCSEGSDALLFLGEFLFIHQNKE